MSTLVGAHVTPQTSLGTKGQKPADEKGWLSRKTFEGLPTRYQEIARELAAAGEISIENMPGMPAGCTGNAVVSGKN